MKVAFFCCQGSQPLRQGGDRSIGMPAAQPWF
jgi:hypothetical protein